MPRSPKAPQPPISTQIDAEAVNRTLSVLGGKWTVQIITYLLGGTRRFGELQAAMGSVSPKMLVSRLRELEAQGLVTRKLYPEIPPRVEYSLTEEGRTLEPIVEAIAQWGATEGQTRGIKRSQQVAD